MPPERLQISVSGVPQGWTSTIVGGGQPIEAVLPATNASVSFELRLDIPKDAAIGTDQSHRHRQGRQHRSRCRSPSRW